MYVAVQSVEGGLSEHKVVLTVATGWSHIYVNTLTFRHNMRGRNANMLCACSSHVPSEKKGHEDYTLNESLCPFHLHSAFMFNALS